jgi:hypothetical protein
MFADFVDCADVGVKAEAARASRRNRSSACGSWARPWQKFQSDEAPKLHVLSLVDDIHPTTAELLDDAVICEMVCPTSWGDVPIGARILGRRSLAVKPGDGSSG